ncbi:uncharacterized protein LOC126742643 [Anthonomus grandis grandis]|uniref:uncharacterized protein LOC126742643 n=1 Tax=Anthonomus grandis grandis TaxID=2921223 RepID=UPI0021663FFA|nr:uncharacterized protein LOC126742643 [Anthonomus grandis grandis]
MNAAPAKLFVLLIATLALNIMCGIKMATEGSPIYGWDRGASKDYEDILAGNDFLSVLMDSTMRRLGKEPVTLTDNPLEVGEEETMGTEPYVRETREVTNYEVPQTTEPMSVGIDTSDLPSSDGVIIAVHVSSSVGSQINKVKESSTPNFLPSEEPPSIIANQAKSELTVEEPTPITQDNDEQSSSKSPESDLSRLQATIQNLPSSQQITFNIPNNKDNLPPFHHSLIYHDTPNQSGRARSVSYSTIIQNIQPSEEKSSENIHERKERHYETGNAAQNTFDETQKTTSTTIKSDIQKPTSTEKVWQHPKIYGKPEQNYEVDEAVSVVTNGRSHGVQPSINAVTQKPTKSDQDKDQKVGYVVEGRNYRKYRVEERTPDGFIVGEYGVVSHDDGSLRGVRYTADGTINPRLIYDALMKFLAL